MVSQDLHDIKQFKAKRLAPNGALRNSLVCGWVTLPRLLGMIVVCVRRTGSSLSALQHEKWLSSKFMKKTYSKRDIKNGVVYRNKWKIVVVAKAVQSIRQQADEAKAVAAVGAARKPSELYKVFEKWVVSFGVQWSMRARSIFYVGVSLRVWRHWPVKSKKWSTC